MKFEPKENLLQILYEDNHLIIVNKPAGMLVQEDDTGDISLVELVKEYLRTKYQKPGEAFCGVVHRIDRPVSGLVIFAKTSKGLERMHALFRERKITKTYWAAVRMKPPHDSGTLFHWLLKDRNTNTVKAFNKPVRNGVEAELRYRIIARAGNYFLLEVNPITGRPHQIRAQLAKIGCPIQGDVKYGFSQPNRDEHSICLHSRQVSFIHPVQKVPLVVSARLPQTSDWQRFNDLNL
ncbi:MAG: RluA family pseudouridine synthase [Cytophagales bacterium]|nr:RluA family pseudouridine synthase [Cytophagales bacterium]MDW8383944.1 RluA family pseudouridine synthase [Flammeovirgaceae bacterium]